MVRQLVRQLVNTLFMVKHQKVPQYYFYDCGFEAFMKNKKIVLIHCCWSVNLFSSTDLLSILLSRAVITKSALNNSANQFANKEISILRIQWMFTKVILCSRLRLWIGYFIYFKFTRVSSIVYQSLHL